MPVVCHVDVRTPVVQTHETRKRIEQDFPLTIERPLDVIQNVFDDKIVEVPTPVTVMKTVFRKEIREMTKEVPKIVRKTVDRIVEVPEIKYVDKFQEVISPLGLN